MVLGFLISPGVSWRGTPVLAQEAAGVLDLVGELDADQTGVREPRGLAYAAERGTFLTLDGGQWQPAAAALELLELTRSAARRGGVRVTAALADPVNLAFDDQSQRLLILNGGELLAVETGSAGQLDPAALSRYRLAGVGLVDPQGLAVDPASGDVLILDSRQASLVRLSGALEQPVVSVIDLQSAGIRAPRALAVDPSSGHVHVAVLAEQKLYELSLAGAVLAWRDLSAFAVRDIQGMVFAPSGDQTDDPAEMSLYLADGGRIMEFSFIAPATLPPGTPLLPASLVRIVDTSNAAWNPSSPDPAGVDYWPLANRLVIADSEVDEMRQYFAGKNIFLSTTAGSLTGTCTTTAFTGEPTGVAVNPANNHIFISSDYQDLVFEITLGPDGTYCTADDTVTQTSMSVYRVTDAEDVAYGNNTLFISGGADAEVYVIPLGPNGILGGGDDGAMSHFDTSRWGFSDLEGIGYNPEAGTLFIVSTRRTDNYLGEVTTSGTLLRAYDLSFMDDIGNIRSDVTYAPGSQNAGVRNIYIASRGVDNDSNRNENDGRVWEISIRNDPTFADVPTSHWAWSWIERVYRAGITGGCGGGNYCPENPVTRAEMAVFLERGMRGSAYTPPPALGDIFGDVSANYWAAGWVEQLAADGITDGCGGGNYCPGNPVTRAQMALFLLRAKHGGRYTPPGVGAGTGFADVPASHWAAAWIKQLAAERISDGCGGGNYCPENPVTRAQMAVFLVRTFNLP